MLHVLRLTYTASESDAAPHVPGHVAFLERHHAAGTFLLSGQTVPTEDGGVVLAAGGLDADAVRRLTDEDPFVQAGVARYDIATVTPGRVHPALKELLADGGGKTS
ncbi:YciI family protein [Actinomadura gamaensis]|uniref:YciI family protein n=1 Tax=Actinomadura gamaensis TaxID=1763541 RepID=A0ABV9UBK8_9ACTN